MMLTTLLMVAALAQVAEQANQAYKTPEQRKTIAQRLTAPDRDAKQRPQALVIAGAGGYTNTSGRYQRAKGPQASAVGSAGL